MSDDFELNSPEALQDISSTCFPTCWNSHAWSGTGEYCANRFDMHVLMEDILDMFYPLAEEKGLQLRYQNHLPHPFVTESDQTLLKQILVNVISNSVKYTHEGSVTIDLRHQVKLEVTITDTGIGIGERRSERDFQALLSLGDPSKSEGSGFGLYVTRVWLRH